MKAIDLRQAVLESLDGFTTDLIELPLVDARGDTNHMAMEREIQAAQVCFTAYEEMAYLTKETHNKSYAFKDLPDDERRKYRSVKHKMDLLNSLYGPKSES